MTANFVQFPKEARAGDVLREIRSSQREHDGISYVYVVADERILIGVVDLRDLVLAPTRPRWAT